MPNNELQELLGARFEDHTQPTNEAVWNAIEAQLDEEQKDRVGIWFWIFNGIAATLLLGSIIQSNASVDTLKSDSHLLTEKSIEAPANSEYNVSVNPENLNTKKTAGSDITNPIEQPEAVGNNPVRDQSNLPIHKSIVNFSSENDHSTVVHHNLQNRVRKETENRTSASERNGITHQIVDQLTFLPINNQADNITHVTSTRPVNNSSDYLKRLPIHLGAEFTYLQKRRNSETILSTADPTYTHVYDQLAGNRHFEFSLFSQFDLSRKFSTSLGIGYSYSNYSTNSDATSSTFSSTTTGMKSKLQLITIPLQATYTIFRQKRFSLNTGITLQGEFGRINLFEQTAQESSGNVTLSTYADGSINEKQLNFVHFAVEPFVQISYNLTPRLSTYINAGYRIYVNQPKTLPVIQSSVNFFQSDMGLTFKIH